MIVDGHCFGSQMSIRESSVSSDQGNDSVIPKRNEAASLPPDEWFETAYGDSPVASLVCDRKGRIVFTNDALRRLFGDTDLGHLSTLGGLDDGCEVVSLISLVDTSLQEGAGPPRRRGLLTGVQAPTVTIETMQLPAPAPLVLFRFHSRPVTDQESRTRLLSQLAGVRRQKRGLREAGDHLVTTIHDHFETPVVLVLHDHESSDISWSAGDEDHCHQMASRLREAGFAPDVVEWPEATETSILSLQIDDDATAHLMIGNRLGHRDVRGPQSFWNCLATTAEATLQSANLFDSNRRERQRLRAVIEQMPMAVILFDPEGSILDLNLRARGLAGRREWNHLLDSDPPYQLRTLSGDTIPRDQWPMIRAIQTGEVCEEREFVLDFGDHQRTISLTIVPIRDDDDQITSYMATGRDITQRTEDERRRDEFLSVASHELRNPLTPLSGLIELAEEQSRSDSAVDPTLLQRAQAQVERLERLVDGLLDVSRLESGTLPVRRRDVEMGQLLAEIMSPWLEGEHGERIEVATPDRSIRASVDPDRIDQVVTNVVDNAVKHGRDDGRITVELSRDADLVVIAVRDDGDGIPESIVGRVFDRHFISTDNAPSGAGLGLYIARQIVEDHDGDITIDSGDGEPTEVLIRLPSAGSAP